MPRNKAAAVPPTTTAAAEYQIQFPARFGTCRGPGGRDAPSPVVPTCKLGVATRTLGVPTCTLGGGPLTIGPGGISVATRACTGGTKGAVALLSAWSIAARNSS